MAYATYEYYQTVFSGVMPLADFNRLAIKASREIDLATNDLAKTAHHIMSIRLKNCTCELADLYYAESKRLFGSEGGTVASVNNDGYSVSFVSSKDVEAALKLNVQEVLKKYLKHPVNLIITVRAI